MKARLILLAATIATACAPAVPRNQVMAYGLAGGMNQSLARTTAQNRAVANLQKLMTVDAVSFAYRVRGEDSAIELASTSEAAKFEATEFLPLAKGWASKAAGLRPAAVVDAMDAMTFTTVTAEAHREDPGAAMMVAESRGIRALLLPLAKECAAAGCQLSGTLSIRELTPEFLADGIRLTIAGNAKIKATAPLAGADAVNMYGAAAAEYGQEKQWDRALAALDRGLAEGANEAKLYAQRGNVLTLRGPLAPPATNPTPPATSAPAAAGPSTPAPGDDPLKPAKIANLREVVAAFAKATELDSANDGYRAELARAQAALAVLEPPPPPGVEPAPAAIDNAAVDALPSSPPSKKPAKSGKKK